MSRTPSRRVKILVSLLLFLHLTALWIGPFSVPPSSMLAERMWRVYSPYLHAAFLNHGYHFFAPEPGPSHLIHYELDFADGTKREGTFPNLEEHWPRLLYHRHFMLTEYLNTLPEELQAKYANAYAQHLLSVHDARRVTMHLRRHYIPRPTEVIEGMKLTDPALYEERLLGTYMGDES